MVDEELSACVEAYVGLGIDSVSEDRVRDRLGERGLRLVPRVRAVIDVLERADPEPWRLGEMAAVAAAADRVVRAHAPELSDAAVRTVVGAYCYSWK